MTVHLTTKQQAALRTRQTLPADLPYLMRHLAQCVECRTAVALPIETATAFWQKRLTLSEPVAHLAYETLAALADDALNEIERDLAQTHLAACADCAAEAAALRDLRVSLEAKPVVTFFSPKSSFGAACARWWRPVSAVTACLLIAVVSWWNLRTTSNVAVMPSVPTPAQVTPSPSSAAPFVAELRDHGQRIALDAAGSLTGLVALAPAHEQLLKQTLLTGEAPRNARLPALRGHIATLMNARPANGTFSLYAPLGEMTASARPQFRWETVTEAQHYVVTVYDDEFRLVATSEPLRRTTWRPAQALPRQRRLQWQVTARLADRTLTAPVTTAREARFQIITLAQANALQHAAQQVPRSHLLMGTLYAEAGLLKDARREFQALLLENPQSELVRRLAGN